MKKTSTKRRYSPQERLAYHQKRVSSKTATENQRTYSRHFVKGYNDPHGGHNLYPTLNEYEEKKAENSKYFDAGQRAIFKGLLYGMKARIAANAQASVKSQRK